MKANLGKVIIQARFEPHNKQKQATIPHSSMEPLDLKTYMEKQNQINDLLKAFLEKGLKEQPKQKQIYNIQPKQKQVYNLEPRDNHVFIPIPKIDPSQGLTKTIVESWIQKVMKVVCSSGFNMFFRKRWIKNKPKFTVLCQPNMRERTLLLWGRTLDDAGTCKSLPICIHRECGSSSVEEFCLWLWLAQKLNVSSQQRKQYQTGYIKMLDQKLDSSSHLWYVQRHFEILRCKLTTFRMKQSIRENVTLFKLLVYPLYRLRMCTAYFQGKRAVNNYVVHMRKNLRRFCRIPYNTPKQVVDAISGRMEVQLKKLVSRAYQGSSRRMGEVFQPPQTTKEGPVFSCVPQNFGKLLWLLHPRHCARCDEQFTTTHIKECFGREIQLVNYLDRFQDKRNRRAIARAINRDIKFAELNSKLWPK